jgi:osmotically-inducible protein OsmY
MTGARDGEYLEAAVQRLLTEDGAVTDQGIDVVCREDMVILRGEVESRHRREEIVRLIREHFPHVRVHDDIGLTRAQPPAEPEELS